MRRRLRLNPSLRDAGFDLGIFLLAQGEIDRADGAFRDAVRRYGRDAKTTQRLHGFIRENVRVQEARQILEAYFVDAGDEK